MRQQKKLNASDIGKLGISNGNTQISKLRKESGIYGQPTKGITREEASTLLMEKGTRIQWHMEYASEKHSKAVCEQKF